MFIYFPFYSILEYVCLNKMKWTFNTQLYHNHKPIQITCSISGDTLIYWTLRELTQLIGLSPDTIHLISNKYEQIVSRTLFSHVHIAGSVVFGKHRKLTWFWWWTSPQKTCCNNYIIKYDLTVRSRARFHIELSGCNFEMAKWPRCKLKDVMIAIVFWYIISNWQRVSLEEVQYN